MPGSVIITIIVVLGVIVAGGFLMYFCGDLLMGLAGKKKDVDVIKAKQQKEKKALEDRVNALSNSDEAKKDPDIAAFLYDGAIVEAYNPDEEEEVESVEPVEEVAQESEEVDAEETASDEEVEETEEVEEEEDETAAFIRQRRAELMARLARMQEEQNAEEETEEEEESEEEETDNSVDLEETEDEEAVETEEVKPEEVNAIIESVEEVETEETTEEVVEDAVEEVEVKEEPKKAVVADRFSTLTLEELEAKLAYEQEKLKENEKDLRQCKKEYIPLKRVKTTLERDENKLRRKEALVAKQKVVLYGVNNYSDIDEEKAKKLAEDLDLLDGLKLSVQHCQEVMDKNEDRYPLLEKIYSLLTAQNEEIKEDIQELQEAIARLQNPTDAE